ncbi:MFS transporter [Paenibacillus gansuensis]|uniref:MFS transporter n=1 Tax=Paenibacillus gansuensis TaxID=306542 RepID=A0ABW5PJ59_9BACL
MNTRKPSWFVFIIALGLFSVINTEFGVIGTFPHITEKYNISVSQAGMLVSLFALTIAVFGPFVTLVLSKYNRKYMMSVVLGVFAAANLASAFAPTFSALLLFRIIPAFFHPVYFSLAFVSAASFYASDQAMKSAAKVFTGGTVGIVIGVPITSFLADHYSLGAAFLFSALVNIIALIGFLLWIPNMPAGQQASYGSQLKVLAKPRLWLHIATIILTLAAMFSVFSYFSEYMTAVTKMNSQWISIMLIVFGASGVIGNLQAGRLLSKNRVWTAAAFPLALAFIYLLLYVSGESVLPMVLLIVLWGVVHTGGFIISQAWLTMETTEAPEFGTSLFVSFSNLGISLGTAAGGWFITRWGTHQIAWSGILFLAASLALILLKVTLDKRQSRPAAKPSTPAA